MTVTLPMGKLFVLVRVAPIPASACPPDLVHEADSLKSRVRLNVYFSESTRLKEINSFHAFQKHPDDGLRRQAMDEPAVYEFKVAQSLSGRWAAWFDGLDLAHDDQGNTLLSGTIIDQAALLGVLTKIRDLNLVLLSVMRK